MEEEHAYSDDEPDDAASVLKSVLQEAAAEPPLPRPPTPEDREVKRRREMLERCVALRLVYGCGPRGACCLTEHLPPRFGQGAGA